MSVGSRASLMQSESISVTHDEQVLAPSPALHRPAANVLGVLVDALDMQSAIAVISQLLRSSQKGYVCAVGVHGVMEAQRNPTVAAAFAGASLSVPDGMPTAWVGRMQGHAHMERVAGPDLMLEVFRRPEFSHCRHFLYGGVAGVAQDLATKLRTRFPGTRIVGTFTPPFRDLTSAEFRELQKKVSAARPDIIWVGISTPRQELFMRKYLAHLETRLMFGIGAAFDFHTGRIHDCPNWVKKAGLQWFHRLLQEPRRLGHRYLRNNPEFLWKIALQLIGLRPYALEPRPPQDFGDAAVQDSDRRLSRLTG